MDYTNLYSTRIQKTLDEDQFEIMSILANALKNRPKLEIQLINYYKGMLVSFKAAVVEINNGIIELDVHSQQAVAISDEHYTFIRSKLFRHDIVAIAQSISIKRKAASLRQLCYVEILAERRNHLRLKLNPSIDAFYTSNQGVVRGSLIELSTAGTIMTVYNPTDMGMEDEAQLLFLLPYSDQNTTCNIKVSARLITILEDRRPFRYIFGFAADKISERHIAKYLFNRQLEIVRELKDTSDIG
jgi:c-di-GMP-binding flagellar brake protein YcgR